MYLITFLMCRKFIQKLSVKIPNPFFPLDLQNPSRSRAKMSRSRTSHSAPSATIAAAIYQLNREGNKYVRQVIRVVKNIAMPPAIAMITATIPSTIARNTAPIPRNICCQSSLQNETYSFNTRYDGTHVFSMQIKLLALALVLIWVDWD